MLVVGIDPGLSGGIAFWDGENLEVYATPTISVDFVKKGKKQKRSEMDMIKAVELMEDRPCTHLALEKVTARPGQGVTSMFRFGENFGQWQGIANALRLPPTFYSPQTWKLHYGLSSEKDASLVLARQLFPNNQADFKLKKYDGLAEAALIAKYHYDELAKA